VALLLSLHLEAGLYDDVAKLNENVNNSGGMYPTAGSYSLTSSRKSWEVVGSDAGEITAKQLAACGKL
jgi:hypothetical protein